MKLLTLENSFRAVLRAHYLQDPSLADWVTLRGMQRCPRDPATGQPIYEDARAAFKACDDLRAAIIDGKVRIHGCLPGNLCGDISTADILAPERINIFSNTLHVGPGRTYCNVCCYPNEVAALAAQPLLDAVALSGKRLYMSAVEACGDLIVKNRDLSKGKIWNLAKEKYPGVRPGEFDFAWERYATEDQKRKGRRKETAVLKH